jgi:hypothetical protein
VSTYNQQAALATDPGFIKRVQAAITKGAATVLAAAEDIGRPQTFRLRTAMATAILTDATPYLARFSWAIVTSPNVQAQVGALLSWIASSVAGPPAVVTTQAAHQLVSGQAVAISGAADQALNGMWAVGAVTASTFTIPVIGTAVGGAGGTVVSQPSDGDLDTAVTAIWNAIAGVTAATV